MFAALYGRREALRSLRPETLLLQMYSLKIALAFGLGAAILVGGDRRFSGPVWDSTKDLVDWSGLDPRVVWGLLFISLGMALVWSLGKPVAVHVLRFGLVVYTFLVLGFLGSILSNPTVSLTGVVVYGCVGVGHALLSVHLAAYGWR